MKRRDLFKAAAMTATGVALGSLSDINTTFAKEVTKMTKEQFSTVFPMGAKMTPMQNISLARAI